MTSICKIPTGIDGLDQVLRGGLRLATSPTGQPTGALLICGGAGTGKTLLAATIADRILRQSESNARGLLALVEQSPTDVALFLAQFSNTLKTHFATSQTDSDPPVVIDSIDPSVHVTTNGATASNLRAQLETWRLRIAEAEHRPVVCILDGFLQRAPALGSLERLAMQDIARYGSDHGLLLILIEEGAANESLPFVCDIVLQLSSASTSSVAEAPLRHVAVQKSRLGGFIEGDHPYEIVEGDGIKVYPALHSYSPACPKASPDRSQKWESYGWTALDEGLSKMQGRHLALWKGGSALLHADDLMIGERIAERFVDHSAKNGECGAVINLWPRGVWVSTEDGEVVEVGDFATAPEKLLVLVLEALANISMKCAKPVSRLCIGNLHALEAFPRSTFERLTQVMQILCRQALAEGTTVLLWAAPLLPHNIAFHCTVRITVKGLTYSYSAPWARRSNQSFEVETLGFLAERATKTGSQK